MTLSPSPLLRSAPLRKALLRTALILALFAGALLAAGPGLGKPKPPSKSDAAIVAETWGFDYDKLLAKALKDIRGEGRAFLALGTLPMFDAGSAEEYEDALGAVLTSTGDAPFAAALEGFSPAQRGQILWWIAGHANLHQEVPPPQKERAAFAAKYPRLWKLMQEADKNHLLDAPSRQPH